MPALSKVYPNEIYIAHDLVDEGMFVELNVIKEGAIDEWKDGEEVAVYRFVGMGTIHIGEIPVNIEMNKPSKKK